MFIVLNLKRGLNKGILELFLLPPRQSKLCVKFLRLKRLPFCCHQAQLVQIINVHQMGTFQCLLRVIFQKVVFEKFVQVAGNYSQESTEPVSVACLFCELLLNHTDERLLPLFIGVCGTFVHLSTLVSSLRAS